METLAKKIYRFVSRRVKLTLKNGEVLIGDILEALDPEDEPELELLNEEALTIELLNGEIILYHFSEIADVERVE